MPRLSRQAEPALIVTTSGVAFGPDITNPTYSATKAALHSLTQAVRLQLERDGSNIKVFEFMAPLVDSPFSAGVVSDHKMSPATAVAELLDDMARDELELHVGITKGTFQALSESSDAAVRAATPPPAADPKGDKQMNTFLITGASRGIGRELTEQILTRGDRVAATLRQPEQLDDLRQQQPTDCGRGGSTLLTRPRSSASSVRRSPTTTASTSSSPTRATACPAPPRTLPTSRWRA